MRIPLLLATMVPMCAEAAELHCIPDKICIPGTCDVPVSGDTTLRMTHPDSAAPALHTHSEIVPMAKTHQYKDQSTWLGVNAAGEHESLFLRRKEMEFIYSIGGPYVAGVGQEIRYRAIGQCEDK